MATWLYRIGEAAARRAWAVILIWVLIIAGVAGAYTTFHGKLSNTFTMPGTQTQQLSDELAQRFPSANRGSGQIILTTGDGTALTEEQKQAFSIALNKLTSEVPSVDAVTDPFTTTSKLAEAKTQLDEAHAKIDAAPSQIEEGKKQLSAAASQIEEGTKQIAESEKKLDDSQAQITSGQKSPPRRKNWPKVRRSWISNVTSYRRARVNCRHSVSSWNVSRSCMTSPPATVWFLKISPRRLQPSRLRRRFLRFRQLTCRRSCLILSWRTCMGRPSTSTRT